MRTSRKNSGLSLLEVIVALAILGTGILAVIQLYSGSLRNTKRASDLSIILIHARSVMDEAYMGTEAPVPERVEFDDGAVAERQVNIIEEGQGYTVYSISVHVSMPGYQGLELTGKRIILGETEK